MTKGEQLLSEWPKSCLEWRDGDVLNISVPFTWELPEARDRVIQQYLNPPKRIRVGGPAVDLMPRYFDGLSCEVGGSIPGVLQRYNPQATRTTTGCMRRCRFCAVPRTEGRFRELPEWPDLPVVCDNNLLCASSSHFDRVCDRLERWEWADFNQGLDAGLMTDYHAGRLKRIGNVKIRFALDSQADKGIWERAFGFLRAVKVRKSLIASYVLIGFQSDPADAWERCEWVTKHGVHACPMWYHSLDSMERNTVTKEQAGWGWNDYERRRIMQWFYRHKKAIAV
jgi:hypothetical protein